MPTMVLRWTPTSADLGDALAAHGSPGRETGRGTGRLLRLLPPVAFLVAGVGMLLLGHPGFAITCAGAAVALLVLARVSGAGTSRAHVLAVGRTRSPVEAVVAPDGLRISGRSVTTRPWSAFLRVVETERSFVLCTPLTRGVPELLAYLPKRALAGPHEVDRLRAELATLVPDGALPGEVRPR